MRPSKYETWLRIARELSRQSTCLRRAVGCVLIDKHGEVDGTGWNGVARGQPHCNEAVIFGADYVTWGSTPGMQKPTRMVETFPHECPGAKSPSGTNLDGCEALHAEQNALLQCKKRFELATCYCTASPCVTCVKLLLNTSCQRIVYVEEYPHAAARDLWVGANRDWIKVNLDPV